MGAYQELTAYQRETEALAAVAGRLGWDQETMMPRGAAQQRGEELAAMEGVLHARRTDPRLGAWLDAAETEVAADNAVARAVLRHVRRSYDRSRRVPAALAAEIARTTSVAQGVWAEARAAQDYAAFAPTLARVLDLKRQEAQALVEGLPDGASAYDALLDEYEPGMTAAQVEALFAALRPRLVALREAVLGAPRPPAVPLAGPFDEALQMALSRELALGFGYDFARGRIDRAVHPFSSGSGSDVRITTRTVTDDPFNCLYSTIHEVGHACYEQGVDPAYALTPLGTGASLGVHESQSRLYENQIGRSRPYTAHLFDRMRATFGEIGPGDAEAFYATVNRVHPGFIRTEADEVHYNLHILMRFDLERALLSGDLAVPDLPGAWNDRFLADFGLQVDRPSNGCLQDVHWSVGLIGYFPTYTLGNVYAGCLWRALSTDLPDLPDALARGDTAPATGWLRERLHRHGALRGPRETVEAACGLAVSEAPLLDYLEAKFGDLYGL